MGAKVREIITERKARLEGYREIDPRDPDLRSLTELGRRTAHRLGNSRVWMLSATERGGGVAEMMPRLVSLLDDLGVDTRWLVLEPGERAFFETTKRLHNMIHGAPGIEDLAQARALYEKISEEASHSLRGHLLAGDVLAVHDPQPAGAVFFLPREQRIHTLWRCHIGVADSNDNTRAAWEFLAPYLRVFDRLVFSLDSYIPDAFFGRAGLIHPGIDPLSHKNRDLRPRKLMSILRAAGLLEGPELPGWARFKAQAQRYADGRWSASQVPALLWGPLIVQVSRFDRLKGFQYLIPAFERLLEIYPERVAHYRADTDRVRAELERVQLVLAGPDPGGVRDDPEEAEVLEGLCAQHRALSPERACRVHLVRLPMEDCKQNALAVNALQRIAAVVVQNSVQEGFGLTVAEALWKGSPVVASNVGGLSLQVRHQIDGLLVDDPCNPDAVARAVLEVLAYPRRAEAMASSGHRRVRDHFLVLSQIRRWLEELDALLQPRVAEEPAQVALGPP